MNEIEKNTMISLAALRKLPSGGSFLGLRAEVEDWFQNKKVNAIIWMWTDMGQLRRAYFDLDGEYIADVPGRVLGRDGEYIGDVPG